MASGGFNPDLASSNDNIYDMNGNQTNDYEWVHPSSVNESNQSKNRQQKQVQPPEEAGAMQMKDLVPIKRSMEVEKNDTARSISSQESSYRMTTKLEPTQVYTGKTSAVTLTSK